jgi:hypothetical protein
MLFHTESKRNNKTSNERYEQILNLYNQAKRLNLKKKNQSVKYDCYLLFLHVN